MSSFITDRFWSSFDLYSDAITGRDAIGGLTRTVAWKSTNACYFTKLTAEETYNWQRVQKNLVVSTHRLFCLPLNIKTTDVIYIKDTWYDVKFIHRTHKEDHIELLLLATRAPQVITYSSSSSTSSSTLSESSSSTQSESSSSSTQSESSSSSTLSESSSSSTVSESSSSSSKSESSSSSSSYDDCPNTVNSFNATIILL